VEAGAEGQRLQNEQLQQSMAFSQQFQGATEEERAQMLARDPDAWVRLKLGMDQLAFQKDQALAKLSPAIKKNEASRYISDTIKSLHVAIGGLKSRLQVEGATSVTTARRLQDSIDSYQELLNAYEWARREVSAYDFNTPEGPFTIVNNILAHASPGANPTYAPPGQPGATQEPGTDSALGLDDMFEKY